MSWLISDSSNASSTGHLSTYDGNLYYNQDSWRLCKNIMWIGPTSQKWQQSFDLDSFYSTDKDFGFNKKFNGFTFNTSAEMPSLSQAQGSLPDEQESYKNISSATFYSKEEAIATQKFYKSINAHISYYTLWFNGRYWTGNVGEAQNGPVISLLRYKRTAAKNGKITMSYSTSNTTKTYYAVYVGGVRATSFISEAVHSLEDFEVRWSNVASGSDITIYHRPYFDGTAPKSYLEDEVFWVMEYCGKNNITSWDTNFSYVTISPNDYGGMIGLYTDTHETGGVVTVSKTFPITVSRSGYKLTDATSSVKRLPKINGLPYKGTTVRTPSYGSTSNFISPNVRHRKSGHFVVTKDGTVSVKCALQSLTAYINSYDNYQQINPTVTIKKNGNVVASYSNPNETKSYTTNITVSAGDLIDVAVSDIFTQNSYYELDYDYEVTDKCYITGDKDETSFTVYKSSYDSSNTPAYDMAFIVSKAGTLNWSYNDVRSGTTSSSDDGILNIFVNGEIQVRADNDSTTSSGSISLSVGDVVLIRYCTFGCSVGNKDAYVYVERGWDTPGGQCTISFSGETTPAAFNHTLSWREYCKLILAEARLWVDDNSLTDYALPIAIIDDAGNLERTNQFYTELSNSKLYTDLWVHADNLTNLNESYVKCFNADMKNSPINADFTGASITQVRIKDATGGKRSFKNISGKISSLELVNISGDWTEAFRNSVSNAVNVGKFTTNGLTSAKDMFRGCEIRGTWNLDEDKLNAFFNDTYDKWVAGDYNFRSAFVGSYHSGTVPESFMSAEDQFACNWDPATLIQKVASTYDVSILPLTNYYFASVTAITSAYSNYLEYSKTVHTIKLVSRQFDESTSAAYIYIDDKAVKGWGSRGHFIGVIDCKTMKFKYEGSGDTYGTPESADAVWTAAINAADPNDIIVAISYDATSVTSSARNSINSCGGNGSTWTSARIAHTFIGKKGLASGQGYENTASGSNYSTISAKFDEDRGLVHRHWAMEQTFGLSPIYEKDGQDAHFSNYPNIIIPEDNFWKWGSVFAQIKDTYDCALFSITENNKANFNVDVYTSGDERQVNYNYDTSFKKSVEANAFDNLIIHLRKVENATNKSISIEGMFNDIQYLHCVGEIKNIQTITSAFE